MEERLQKYMAKCGVASRRKCEEIILNGNVEVNGSFITELGFKVNENDVVKVNGNIIKVEENKVYIILNKPTGYITSNSDEKDRKTILDIVNVKERIYPIGRLDYDSSGLLLLTNDGDVYNKIIHPKKEIEKRYLATVKGSFSKEQLEKFKAGVDIGGYITAPAKIKVVKEGKGNSVVEITIHEGKNRQVRKMCSAFNHEVLSLKRIAIGKLSLDDLKEGHWRYLNEKEISYLKSLN
ncbi:pseudouridine synthase [Clostridium massiliamazoniense]|uniref:pseudouridine synthase n=1 Tax=Clostridium massiliamazoniense TaxID=1347366 RepID=UPI0006D773AA|nr:pseudouridine synthase [Clostridium massiliamazoniense]